MEPYLLWKLLTIWLNKVPNGLQVLDQENGEGEGWTNHFLCFWWNSKTEKLKKRFLVWSVWSVWSSSHGSIMVWKVQEFSVTQVLREINFGEFRSSKTAFLTILKALNFVYFVNYILHKVHKNQNQEPLNVFKMVDFESQDSHTLISRKI